MLFKIPTEAFGFAIGKWNCQIYILAKITQVICYRESVLQGVKKWNLGIRKLLNNFSQEMIWNNTVN